MNNHCDKTITHQIQMIIDQTINNNNRHQIVIFNNSKRISTRIKKTKKITFLIKIRLIKKNIKMIITNRNNKIRTSTKKTFINKRTCQNILNQRNHKDISSTRQLIKSKYTFVDVVSQSSTLTTNYISMWEFAKLRRRERKFS